MKAIYNDTKKLTSILNRKISRVFVVRFKQGVYTGKVVKTTGVKTFGWVNLQQGQQLLVTLNTTHGKAKLILVNKHKQLVTLAEQNSKGVVQNNLVAGWWRLRFVGQESNATFAVSVVQKS